jgi:hypothetical protein
MIPSTIQPRIDSYRNGGSPSNRCLPAMGVTMCNTPIPTPTLKRRGSRKIIAVAERGRDRCRWQVRSAMSVRPIWRPSSGLTPGRFADYWPFRGHHARRHRFVRVRMVFVVLDQRRNLTAVYLGPCTATVDSGSVSTVRAQFASRRRQKSLQLLTESLQRRKRAVCANKRLMHRSIRVGSEDAPYLSSQIFARSWFK